MSEDTEGTDHRRHRIEGFLVGVVVTLLAQAIGTWVWMVVL